MKRALIVFAASTLALSACDKKSDEGHAAPSATTSAPIASASAASSATPAASGSAHAGSATAASGTWKGAYKAKVGAVTPPKDAKIRTWSDDKGDKQVGDGTITLTVTAGRVHGEAKGALGEQTIDGVLDGDDLRARVDAKDPNAPDAMSGVLQGKLENGTLVCTLRVASRDANHVREAEPKLTKGE